MLLFWTWETLTAFEDLCNMRWPRYCGGGTGLVARLVFKTCGRPEEGLGWVRFPHIPASNPPASSRSSLNPRPTFLH